MSCVGRALRKCCPSSRLIPVTGLLLARIFNVSIIRLCTNGSAAFSIGRQGRLSSVLIHLRGLRPVRCVVNARRFCNLAFRIGGRMLVPHPRAKRLMS